jgi:hypothetical protein
MAKVSDLGLPRSCRHAERHRSHRPAPKHYSVCAAADARRRRRRRRRLPRASRDYTRSLGANLLSSTRLCQQTRFTNTRVKHGCNIKLFESAAADATKALRAKNMPGEFKVVYKPRKRKDDMDANIYSPHKFCFRSTRELSFYVEEDFAAWALPRRAFSAANDAYGITAKRALDKNLVTEEQLAHVMDQS